MKPQFSSSVLRMLTLALAVSAVAFSVAFFARFQSGSLLSDFRGFYCAGRLAFEHRDPYLQEPLYSCEAAPSSAALWRASGNVTDPVPLPPYVIALFVPFAWLPFHVAAALWTLLLALAWLTIALTVRALSACSWPVVGSALLFGAMMSLSLGQVAPLAIAALSAAALLLKREQPGAAGAVATLAMIEPHVALPACVALFIAVPRSRLPVAFCAVALFLASLLFGIDRNIEYLRHVLSSHAVSDVPDVGQFSATALAHVIGLADRTALMLGGLWYVIACAIGIAAAVSMGKIRDRQYLVPMLPMAFAVFGGSYVHWQQVVGAVPVVLLVLPLGGVSTLLMTSALIGLAVPWLYVVAWGFLIPAATVVTATLSWQLLRPRLLVGLLVGVGTFAVLLWLNHALPHGGAPAPFTARVSPKAYADDSWGAYVRARIPIGHGFLFWLHVPTWAALGTALASILHQARKPRAS